MELDDSDCPDLASSAGAVIRCDLLMKTKMAPVHGDTVLCTALLFYVH